MAHRTVESAGMTRSFRRRLDSGRASQHILVGAVPGALDNGARRRGPPVSVVWWRSRTRRSRLATTCSLQGWGLDRGLALVKKAGFDGIELWLGANPWLQPTTTDAAGRGSVETCQKRRPGRVECLEHVRLGLPDLVAGPEDPRTGIPNLERQIAIAPMLETDAILMVAGLVTAEVPYSEVYPRTVEGVQRLAEHAGRAKVRIGCENCCSEQRFLMSPREFGLFLDDVGSPHVGLHLDVGNIHDTGFPEQWIEMHGAGITRVHVKDVLRHRGRCGNESVYTNLFLGDNNWPAIHDAFKKVGYDGWLIAEMESRYRHAPDQQFFDTVGGDGSCDRRELLT